MTNQLSSLLKRLKFWLFEEREYIYSDNPKRRRQLHNAYVIQALAALTGIMAMAIIPLVVWLINIQGFVLGYLIFSAVAGIFYITINLYVKHLNKQYELNQ
jgi:hypothetical protein